MQTMCLELQEVQLQCDVQAMVSMTRVQQESVLLCMGREEQERWNDLEEFPWQLKQIQAKQCLQ